MWSRCFKTKCWFHHWQSVVGLVWSPETQLVKLTNVTWTPRSGRAPATRLVGMLGQSSVSLQSWREKAAQERPSSSTKQCHDSSEIAITHRISSGCCGI